jgi:hypothetical protein
MIEGIWVMLRNHLWVLMCIGSLLGAGLLAPAEAVEVKPKRDATKHAYAIMDQASCSVVSDGGFKKVFLVQ